MGLIDTAPLIITPHPVTLDGQRAVTAELQQGERLGAFLARTVPDYSGDLWEVRINGVVVPHEVMDRVRPKGGTVIEVRGVVKKTALMIVALVALTVFTMGVGTAIVAAGYGAAVAGMAQAAIYAAGSLLINKVLGPKPPKPSASDAGAVYSLGAARNQPRPYQPLPLLLGGPLLIAPDVASNPYSWYEADDQYLAMTLAAGINVGRVEALYNGDALLSSFEGVTVWHNGFTGMPNEAIPLYSNADTINGGALEAEKGQASPWVQRTSSLNTIRLKVDVDFMLFDTTSKGKPKDNQETIEVQYRAVGVTNWSIFGSYPITSRSQKQQRRSYSKDVPEGQYEVRVRIAGRNTDGSGATSDFTWSTLTSIQKDTADYAGLARIGIRMKATGQLNGQPDEIRCVAHAVPAPVWTEAGWVTQETNNPGALILAYARGFKDQNGKLIAGIGLDDVQIDIEALKAFMLFCQANSYGYSHYIKDVRSHDDVLGAVALAGFGQISWAGGRLSVAWVGSEQPLSGVVNMATIKKGQFQVDYTLANAADGIEYSFFDATDWTTKTLRVAAPGVTTMLNPATVEGEGVTSEAQAAQMARYHLAQSLYQYKDITYSTDIEHLSYRRLSVLALQHDLTQWGFGGRLVSAAAVNGVVTLKLDEPVPAPANGNAWIGLRVPGERVYRVFGVQPFSGTSEAIRLTGQWPADAPLPGAAPDNPAHDTIWIYDFKQTPGYRVRVTGVEPESDLKGAKVSVVPEPPEFWNYVLTGQYVPPANPNPVIDRPIASALTISEQQVVQGDTVFTELTATFAITGPVGNIVVSAAGSDGVLNEVAQTTTRTATWRISHADQYTVVVRPFSPDGRAGVAVSGIYITAGADVPPRLVDFFDVDELSGGVRMYSWGFLADSIQSPDFAGVEIRYIAGAHTEPVWDQMTPIGGGGYHPVPFEAVVPEAGQWTFACRSVNTSGELSTNARVVSKLLGANLGEVIGGIGKSLEEQTRKQIEQQRQIDQEKLDRISGDAQEAFNRASDIAAVNASIAAETAFRVAAVQGVADDLQDTANELAQEKLARAEAILNEKLERVAAVGNLSTTTQSQFESVAQQIGSVAAGSGTQFDQRKIWYFDTTTDGWTSNGTPTVVDGMLRPANSATAYAQTPAGIGVDGNAYRFIKTRVKRVGNPPWRGLVRWTTDADQTWDDAKSVTIPLPSFDASGLATVDIDLIPWNGPSPVRAVRMALVTVQTTTDYLMYDYVAVGRPTPGAGVAQVQEVQTALQQADQVIASSVTTLGVQMRGQYEGTDPLQLTSGLMYNEMTARITADQAQVQRISAMESRMPTGSGKLASEARVSSLEEATTTATSALAQSITNINATLPAMIVQGSNHALNGTWESGRDVGWRYVNPGTTLNVVNEGRSGLCLRVDGGTGVRQALVNGNANVTVVPGRTYRVSCWYRTTADYNGTSSNGKLRLGNQTGGQIGSNTFAANRVDWTYTERVHAVPTDGSVTAYRVGILADHTTGTLWVDDVMIEEVTELLANAQGLVALTNTVTQQGQQITAQAGLISALRTDVDGKASNSALQSLQSQVTLQGSDITSLGQSVTNITASLNSIGGDNQLANSGFELGTAAGWTTGSGNVGSAIFTRTLVDSSLPGSTKAYRLAMSGLAANGYGEIVSNTTVKVAKVEPGKKVAYSAYVRGTPGPRFFMQIAWVNAQGGVIGYTSTPSTSDWVVPAETWTRMVFVPTNPAPANAEAARCYLRCYGNGAADQWVEWDNVQLQVGSVATGYMPSMDELSIQTAANANATATLTGTVTQQGQQITSLGQSVTTVNAQLQSVGGDNLLPNASLEDRASDTAAPTGYTSGGSVPSGATLGYVDSDLPGSTKAVRRTGTSTAANQYLEIRTVDRTVKATAGQTYVASAFMRGSGGTPYIIMWFLDAAGGTLGGAQSDSFVMGEGWKRFVSTPRVAPVGTAFVRVYFRCTSTAAGQDMAIEIDNVMLQQGEVATNWTPSASEIAAQTAANAAATSTLTGKVDQQGSLITALGQQITTVSAELSQSNRAGSNMVVDGSFENRAAGTAIQTWAVVVPGGRTGSNALQVSFASNTRSTNLQTFDVAPGRIYYCEAWVKRVGPAAGTMQLRFQLSNNGASPTYPNFQTVTLSTIPEDGYVKVSGRITIPDGKNRAVLQLNSASATTSATQLLWDDFVLLDVTEASSAQQTADGAASGLASLTATVTQQGQTITAQGTQINQVGAAVEGKASAQALIELDAKVVRQMTGAGNLLSNAGFTGATTVGWSFFYSAGNIQGVNRYFASGPGMSGATDPGVPVGMRALIVAGGTSSGDFFVAPDVPTPIDGGKTYLFSAYASGNRGELRLEWYDVNDSHVGDIAVSGKFTLLSGGPALANYSRLKLRATAPANAVRCRTILVTPLNGGSWFTRWLRPQFEEVASDQVEPSPWAAGGAEEYANINMFTDVNGYIAGMQVKNNGATSAINMLASAVNILTPGGADGIEMTQGYIRVWAGNSQRIIGNNFGTEGLIDYFGPNVGAANASKANATMWMDRNGSAYWGGALSAGVLKNAAQSTSIVTVGNSVLVGPFDTNGRNKQVVIGFNRVHTRIKDDSYGSSGFVAGAGQNSGIINLYRQIEGQSETLWQQVQITGGVDIVNEVDGPDRATSTWYASMTVNDNADGSTRRSYRAEVASFTEQIVSHSSGTFNKQTITQSLSVVSVEQ